MQKKYKVKHILLLHAILFLYSLGGVASKIAASNEFLSRLFLLFYGLVLLSLFIYAVLWQQILKCLPLTTAFSNKSVVVVWGMIWGHIFFRETIKWHMIAGTAIIFMGVYLVVSDNG